MQLATTTPLWYITSTSKGALIPKASPVWEWCYECHIFLIAVHVASADNLLADRLSRLEDCIHEWSLDSAVFHSCARGGALLA